MAALDVLVVDGEGDPHGEAVIEESVALGGTAVRYNLADLGRHIIQVQPGLVDLVTDDGQYRITSATTVWWRRQGAVDVSDLDDEKAQLAQDEGPHILQGALQSAGVRWVDDPDVVNRAELKIFQLQVASKLDIRVPSSIITNDPDTACNFGSAGPTVAKALSPGIGIAPHTAEIHDVDLILVSALPTLLQEKVSATADLRVVVVGEIGWVWRRERGRLTLDWRAEDPYGSSFQIIDDAEMLHYACQISSALGLSMSVQDWLETDDGPVFLESNAQGNWHFLEGARENVAPALARFLASRTEPGSGFWPSPWKRMTNDFMPEKLAPPQDGARPPRFESPRWAVEAAGRSGAIEVARRSNDQAKLGVTVAEEKASRLVRTALSILTIAFLLGGFQLRAIVDETWAWWFTLVPVAAAIMLLSMVVFQALQIDRVGFFHHPSGESLGALGVEDPIARIVAEEEIGRRYASWTSKKKHSDLMQARAWFTRGLVCLISAALLALVTWPVLTDISDNKVDLEDGQSGIADKISAP